MTIKPSKTYTLGNVTCHEYEAYDAIIYVRGADIWGETISDRAELGPFKSIKHMRHALLSQVCNYCAQHTHNEMMPSHFASSRCESGQHNHCTCDVCF